MQKDEEVGKVAQATPVVICTWPPSHASVHVLTRLRALAKALEMFLQMIVEEAAKVTAERGAKKVEAYHLCVSRLSFHPLSMPFLS